MSSIFKVKTTQEVCHICGKLTNREDMYEYRGAISCSKCFKTLQANRDAERAEIIEESHHKTDCFRGLDLSPDSIIGRANRKLLRKQIDIAKKESGRRKNYNYPSRLTRTFT